VTSFLAVGAVLVVTIQLATAVIALVGVLQGRQHLQVLDRIDVQTNHTNQVLNEANQAAHADMSALAHQLADADTERGKDDTSTD
jgi:hypothetical protein